MFYDTKNTTLGRKNRTYMDLKPIYFVSGIDTDAGKTIVTGVLARYWRSNGASLITQKMIQTGCLGLSKDIIAHRKIMDIDLLPEDLDGTTCPLVFTYPASPHLAAQIDNRDVDLSIVEHSTETLLKKYDTVLLEGAGGLLAPLEGEYTTLDYIQEHDLPVIMVTSSRLGSINHTLLSLEVCETRGIEVDMLVYNNYPPTADVITDETRSYLRNYLEIHYPKALFWEVDDRLNLYRD